MCDWGLAWYRSNQPMRRRTSQQEQLRNGAGLRSRSASISTRPDGKQSECDRERAERSRLGRSHADHWTRVPGTNSTAGQRITVAHDWEGLVARPMRRHGSREETGPPGWREPSENVTTLTRAAVEDRLVESCGFPTDKLMVLRTSGEYDSR